MTLKPFGNTSQAKTIKISSPNPTLAKRLGWGMRFGFIQDEVVFHGEPGIERSQEVLPGVGVLFGWEYQTGERNGREVKTSLSSSWFPLTPPDSRNVLEQAQTLAAALIQHRLEQRLEHQPSASKPRF